MGADAEHTRQRRRQTDRQRRVGAGAYNPPLGAANNPCDRIVDMPNNGAVVDEEKISNTLQPFQRFPFVNADRLVSQISAGGNNWELELLQQKMMQRRVGQHDPPTRAAGWDGSSPSRLTGSAD